MGIDASGGNDSAQRQAAAMAAYDAARAAVPPRSATDALLAALGGSGPEVALGCARTLILRADATAARAVLAAAHSACPGSVDVALAYAGVLRGEGQSMVAGAMLGDILAAHPDHAAATFQHVAILREAGRMTEVARRLRAFCEASTKDMGHVIRAIEILQDCQRQRDAAAICALAFARGADDPRLHAYAGMLRIQLGEFQDAREHYAAALRGDPCAVEWNVPLGLAASQRYAAEDHPDFAFFRATLERKDLSPRARSETLFALAKACDDIGHYAQAAHHAREANVIAHASRDFSRKRWRRILAARLAGTPPPFTLPATTDWAPLFVVGVPRSGTTLVASLLARHPDVCNRGELPWLPELAPHVRDLSGDRLGEVAHAAAIYTAQSRQDGATAHWFIDKQPQNLLHVDLIAALWPQARIVYCVRGARDTALSLWLQSFLGDTQAYAYDWADIAAVIDGYGKLGAHWRGRYGAMMHTVRYEDLVADPDRVMAALRAWLGLSPAPAGIRAPDAINTASLWQARQPVYTRSVGRWRHYAEFIPELTRLPPD